MNEIKEMRVIKDGNCWCFVLPNFKNLQVSPSVWRDEIDTGFFDSIYDELIEQVERAK
jgi:hypothetical protein